MILICEESMCIIISNAVLIHLPMCQCVIGGTRLCAVMLFQLLLAVILDSRHWANIYTRCGNMTCNMMLPSECKLVHLVPPIHPAQALEIRPSCAQAGADICFTVTLLDGLVLARSGFHHSANSRSVVVLGKAETVTDPGQPLSQVWQTVSAMHDNWYSIMSSYKSSQLAGNERYQSK